MRKSYLFGALAVAAVAIAAISCTEQKQEPQGLVIEKQGVFSSGGRVGWATDTDNMAAIIAVEPGFGPEVGSDTYKKFVAAKIPMLFLFGDYIENGPDDIQSTGFWKMVLQQCRDFAKQYNADGGDAMVIYLPDENIHGNSHFMFQEKNNAEIADLMGEWLKKHNL